ncbi:TetR/AcrR family transcriptional regulator [Agrococcus sp. SGAir0287]|uniref:TetR/AcrR family transcriptional regulator n=1 Tax=Agrococcus sp. SGAir0287 TaxID=2070347 RepID=UPI0010CCC966|nr:TetR/AcrR family transcriptional regulator [Agrococcus sp. SGAir0287]QCR18465.1 TetR family transcriptional regulator [Agrococcus sp. SGAir0287]
MQHADAPTRRKRADAVRNTEVVLEAAKSAFAELGVDAPMREIAARAGVGVGTIYRNYPQRSDLIVAVFRREVAAVAASAERVEREHPPEVALRAWAEDLARFVATKRGFAAALHSGDPAYRPLPDVFLGTVGPPVQRMLDAGAVAGTVRGGVTAEALIRALSRLVDDEASDGIGGMAGLLLDGLLGPRP